VLLSAVETCEIRRAVCAALRTPHSRKRMTEIPGSYFVTTMLSVRRSPTSKGDLVAKSDRYYFRGRPRTAEISRDFFAPKLEPFLEP
jgi:hypothetical protein